MIEPVFLIIFISILINGLMYNFLSTLNNFSIPFQGMMGRKPAVLRRLQFPHKSEAVDAEVCRLQRTGDIQEGSPLPVCVPRLSIWRWMATTGPGTSDSVDVRLLRTTSVFTRCASSRLLQLILSRWV